jgi:hypothetical protein
MTRRTLLILALITALTSLGACSGGDGNSSSDDAVAEAPSEDTDNDTTPEADAETSASDETEDESEPRSESDPQALKELKGTYETSLTLKDVRKAGAIDLAIDGDYEIEMTGDGYIVPRNAKFEEAAGRPIQAAEMTVTKGSLSTKLYSGFPECGTLDAGTYAWTLKGGALTFKLEKDECGLRKALFLTHPWTQA